LYQVLWRTVLEEIILAIRQPLLEGGEPTRLPLDPAAQAA
jgi:hypothetical protein